MTYEEREILLKDLSARLPYRTKIHIIWGGATKTDTDLTVSTLGYLERYTCKPYLRPMSSMTEEERKEWNYLYLPLPHNNEATESQRRIDWLNAHHFDYRGLIEKGLALEAKEDTYIKTKEK